MSGNDNTKYTYTNRRMADKDNTSQNLLNNKVCLRSMSHTIPY